MKKINKRAIQGLIIISFLFLSATFSFIYLKNMTDLTLNNLENLISGKSISTFLKVEKIDGTFLYLNNEFNGSLKIQEIYIGGKKCDIEGVFIENGEQILDLGYCLVGLKHLEPYELIIITNLGIKNQNILIKNIIENSLIVELSSQDCDLSSGFINLFSLYSSENSHVTLQGDGTLNLCLKHIFYELSTFDIGGSSLDLFYLLNDSNSAVWTDKGEVIIPQDPQNWVNISLFSQGGEFEFIINNNSLKEEGFVCIGKIIEDNVYGSHLSSCSSSSFDDILWLKLI